MSKVYFQILCDKIEDIVGNTTFKSERYLTKMMHPPLIANGTRARNIVVANDSSTGGMISGEVKLALTLRILGGGTYMDMAMIFEVSFNQMHKWSRR